MENYEKLYKEALERAKECHIDGLSLHQPVKDVLEHIFPELKQSEDEKIRKAIRTIILSSDTKQCQIVGVSKSDMFAWLEKQGEQNQWKPSKEHIEALDEVYKTHAANSICRRVIFDLMQQLKAL